MSSNQSFIETREGFRSSKAIIAGCNIYVEKVAGENELLVMNFFI